MRKKLLRFLIITLSALWIFSFSTFAQTIKSDDIQIEIPDNFTVINTDNVSEHKDYLESINFSEKAFEDYKQEKSIIVYGTDKNGSEISVICRDASFSKKIDDLYYLEYSDIESVFDEFLTDKNYTILESGQNRFLKYEYKGKDKGGDFSGFELITIKNGKIYTINYSVSGNDNISENIKLKLINSFEYTGKSSLNDISVNTIITLIILILAIIVCLSVVIYLVYTFVRDIKAKKEQNDVAPYVKIKRRKF